MIGREAERNSPIDYWIWPIFLAVGIGSTVWLLRWQLPGILVSSLVVGTAALFAAILERIHTEKSEYKPLDLPFTTDLAHFLINYQLGYAIAIAGCMVVEVFFTRYLGWHLWPGHWHLIWQVLLAGFLAEGVSYWQHRLVHQIPWLWKFHALHHSGERLNLIRAGRFHFVDIGTGAFFVFLPLVMLGAPEQIVTWIAVIAGIFGVLEHANIKMRTPSWLHKIICTPAVHRHHHSAHPKESESNFGTLIMLFDILFGTYAQPDEQGPTKMGIEQDPVPRDKGFWKQMIEPFIPDRPNSDKSK